MSEQSLSSQIFTRKMLICVFTGFSSGLPLFVLLQMLPVWLTDKKLSVELIGALTGVMVPYGLKFLWAPLLDRYFPHFLGRRRSWLLISQVILLISLYAISQFDPVAELSTVAKIATFIAFFSATQDIVLDAYRREILTDNELGLGNTIHINAYRVAGLIPGGLSLYLATIYPWETVFLLTALCMLAGIFMTLFLAKEPNIAQVDRDQPFYVVFWIPLKEFFQRKGVAQAIGFLLFLFLYKFGDSFATTLQTKFVYDMGFEKEHIALVVKSTSLWASISAGLVGGVIMLRLGINRALWVFGFIQLITIGGFIWLAAFGHFDHIGAVRALMTPETELVVHAQDAPMLSNQQENASFLMGAPVTAPEATKLVHEGDTVTAAGLTFTVLHTPGHTAGSVCYQIGDKLFTGDTLFRFGGGRTDLPTGSSEQMQASLARVVPMARNLEIYPGHGD